MAFLRANSTITPERFQNLSSGQVQFHLFLTSVSYFRDHSALLYISVKLCCTHFSPSVHKKLFEPSSLCLFLLPSTTVLIYLFLYMGLIADKSRGSGETNYIPIVIMVVSNCFCFISFSVSNHSYHISVGIPLYA